MAVTGLGTMREELQATSVDALFQRGEAERLVTRPKAQEDLEKIAKSERADHRLLAILRFPSRAKSGGRKSQELRRRSGEGGHGWHEGLSGNGRYDQLLGRQSLRASGHGSMHGTGGFGQESQIARHVSRTRAGPLEFVFR